VIYNYNANTADPSIVIWTNPFPKAWTTTNSAICPDLLCHSQLGAADGWRGRVVRAVFFVLRAWPPSR